MKCSSFCLVCTSSLWPQQTMQKLGLDPFFFPCSEHRAGSIRASVGGFDPWGRSLKLLSDADALAASALEFIFGITVLASASVCGSGCGFPRWWLLESSRYRRSSGPGGLFA